MNLHSSSPPRRGVILLVLLGMLALFTATAFAFVVIASHANRTTKSQQKVDRVLYSPTHDIDEIVRQVVVGPIENNATSVLRGSSLLEDLYGGKSALIRGWVVNQFTVVPNSADGTFVNPKGLDADYLPGTATVPASYQTILAGGQIIEFTAGYTIPNGGPVGGLDIATGDPITGSPILASHTITIPAEYGTLGTNVSTDNEPFEFQRRVGCVLTVIDPNSTLHNRSTRIVGYRRVETRVSGNLQLVHHRFQVLPFEGVSGSATHNYFASTRFSGDNFIINGAPFSGTGAGYSATSRVNDAGYDGASPSTEPYALLPNPTDPAYHANVNYYSANEDYDAPDYQNMLLALEHWDGLGSPPTTPPMTLTRDPSLHRPALANYWIHYLANKFALLIDPGMSDPATSFPKAWTLLLQPYGPDGIRGNSDDSTVVPLATVDLTERDRVLQLKRRCLLRPLLEDHPNFDGSNSRWPAYAGVTIPASATLAELQRMAQRSWGAVNLTPGATMPWDTGTNDIIPWDVDNDGDGYPDSIWADLGLPIRTLPDGRKYKPLAAIHCIDLDGRLNLNTAGSSEQLDTTYSTGIAPATYQADNTIYAQPLTQGAAPTATVTLARGQGCGPAEIGLSPLGTLANQMLRGSSTNSLDGRYGELLQNAAGDLRWPAPGFTPTAYSSYTSPSTPTTLTMARLFGFPANYYTSVMSGTATAYGSPMDLKGTLAVGLDLFGQPIYSAIGGPQGSAISRGWNSSTFDYSGINSPYELKLGSVAAHSVGVNAGWDDSFTVAELEPILRRYDADVLRLPARLRLLLNAGPNSLYRLRTTTESWDIPVPGIPLSAELRQGWETISTSMPDRQPLQHLADLIAARVAANTGAALPSGLSALTAADALRVDLTQLLSTDVLMGLRMDLNRPFGNGADDKTIDTDGDGTFDIGNEVVDEPLESGGLAYRQAYAKTLYILMMALVDRAWYPYWDAEIARQLNADPAFTPSETLIVSARARAIAQWAVNVVDFRDSDTVMTPFEYDVYPFARATSSPALPGELIATWKADGDVSVKDPFCDIVWGCERPELVITETLATHDRRQRNTANAGDPPNYVNSFRPEGSLFVELYNPWPESEPGPPELYRDYANTTNARGVRLNQTTLAGDDPVWRLAVYDLANAADDDDMPTGLGYRDPHDDTDPNPATLKRLVYFVPGTATLPEVGGAEVTFSPSATSLAPIRPRRYAVVGPGNAANSQYSPGATLLDSPPSTAINTIRRIQLNPSSDPNALDQVQVFSNASNDDLAALGVVDYSTSAGGAIQPPVAVVIDQGRTGSAGALRNLRLSISEPPAGYAADADSTYNWTSGYATPQDPAEDLSRTDGWGADDPAIDPPVWTSPLAVPGTTSAVRYIHLQRLADPLRPYDAATNPYFTIDSAPVDLTVFDSVMDISTHQSNQARVGYPKDGTTTTDCIATRQRGEIPAATVNSKAFWTSLVLTDPATAAALPIVKNAKTLATPRPGVPSGLGHSLGYLNDFFFTQSPLNTSHLALSFAYAKYAGAPGVESGTSGSYIFTPDCFPWLTWLNRPFANSGELLQVPALSSSRLLLSFENELTKTSQAYSSGQDSFAHTLPFLSGIDSQTPKNSGKLRGFTTNGADVPALTPHFYRILDYLHVPSRFVDSQIRGEPTLMAGGQHPFQPPLNFIPTYREPGKINLNTIADDTLRTALANNHYMPAWADFVAARRGFPVAVATDYFGFDSAVPPLPTRIANPYRSFAGAQLVPPIPGRAPTDTAYASILAQNIEQGVNATLLRAVFDPTKSLDQRTSLFAANLPTAPIYADTAKNPCFQYQSLARLSNLTTTRSNVYAVWITVGYFEVQQVASFDPTQSHIYPEGYTLGQELGIDTGDVTRHRAFYIIDRSIPVGFMPGEKLNTDNTILLRRFIE